MPVATLKGYSAQTGNISVEALYTLHKDLVFRAAYSVTGNKLDAEDARQSVFIRLIQRGIPDMHNSAGYLYRSAINEALKIVRTRRRHSSVDEENLPEPSTDASPLEEGMREKLLDGLAQLEDRDVELIVLSYQMGYTDAEIAM